MSEYADIKIGNYILFSFRNYLDKTIVSTMFSDMNLFTKDNYKFNEEDEEESPVTQYYYKSTVKHIKDRLNLLGFGIKQFEIIFNERGCDILNYSDFLIHLGTKLENIDDVSKKRFAEKVTFRKWTNSLKKIVDFQNNNGMYFEDITNLKLTNECDKIIYYSIRDNASEYRESYGLNIDYEEFPFLFNLILSFFDESQEVVLDFTNLQFWSLDAIENSIHLNEVQEKKIVLLEGTSDKTILEFCMEQIYPHLRDLVYFMDFSIDGNNFPGGASLIVSNIKAYYFARLRQKIIGLFDNDAEGFQNLCRLKNSIDNCPSNIDFQCYPELSFFNKFPCQSPLGNLEMGNINKKAASIELYLPDEFLKDDNDNLFPIVWKERKEIEINNHKEFFYHGTISNKDLIKERFFTYINKVKRKELMFNINDWSRIKSILDIIIK